MVDNNLSEKVARAIFDSHNATYGPLRWENDPEHWRRYANAALTVIRQEEAGETDLGECELCAKSLMLGQFVNQYDDIGTAHANCDSPFAAPTEPTPSPEDDGTVMDTYALLGVPALLISLRDPPLLTEDETADLVERINADPYLQPLPPVQPPPGDPQ